MLLLENVIVRRVAAHAGRQFLDSYPDMIIFAHRRQRQMAIADAEAWNLGELDPRHDGGRDGF
jgi:hypothetical protein